MPKIRIAALDLDGTLLNRVPTNSRAAIRIFGINAPLKRFLDVIFISFLFYNRKWICASPRFVVK